MKSLLTAIVAGVVLGGALFADYAEAGDRRKGPKHRRAEVRYEYRDVRYFRGSDVHVIRDPYRPYYRPLPRGLRHRYYRTGHLPPGWAKRMRPIPMYAERDLVVLPRGYLTRSIIVRHATVPGKDDDDDDRRYEEILWASRVNGRALMRPPDSAD